MEYFISRRFARLKPSAIREMFKYSSDPRVISMAAGSPAPETLPVENIRRLMDEIMKEDIEAALVYASSEGYAPLREVLREFLSSKHSSCRDSDDLIVLTGAQQCMDLAARVLCDEGDTVLVEDPSFIGSLNAFRSYGLKLAGVPLEKDGIDINRLEDSLKKEKNVRFIYLIPNFHNPTSVTMSLEKRRACYDLAKKYGVLIVEDDPYGDLRFMGEPIPSIKSMDEDGIVLYARTFSKILSPGIRVGYFSIPKEISGPMVVAKQCADVHTDMVAQLLCYRFMTECDLHAHIEALKKIYLRKCMLMLDELSKAPSDRLAFTRPEGGLFVMAELAGCDDASEFCLRLVRDRYVAVVPGATFSADASKTTGTFRMTFATPSDEQIVKAITAIREAVSEL